MVQGLSAKLYAAIPASKIQQPLEVFGFIVREWTFSGVGTSGDVDYPFKNDLPTGFHFRTETQYLWGTIAEVQYSAGTPGQNNPKPASFFNNHQFVYVDTAFICYDPSYGVKYISPQDVDNTLSGFFRQINNSSYYFRKNPAGNQVVIFLNERREADSGNSRLYRRIP